MEKFDGVSVIVCTYNRANYFARCLDHLAQQTAQPSEYEIVIVNNNSPDHSADIAQAFMAKHPHLQVQYKLETQQGHTYARNAGIAMARGKYLAFIDDDAFVYPDYCAQINQFFAEYPETGVLGGRLDPIYDGCEEPAWMNPWLLPLVAALNMGPQPKTFANNKFPTGANMAFRADIFQIVGVFDVALGRRGADNLEGGDEKDMVFRARAAGYRVMYAPNVRVDHIIPPHRITLDYVKGLATGVGRHERKRLQKKGSLALVKKWALEIVKWVGTLVLAAGYLLRGKWAVSTTLVRFRWWVAQGLLTR
jgi:glycosyltransferase involved in cell wall biosynthesis